MAVGDPEADLHHKKNKPEHPPGHAPEDFPPYVFRPFPAWIYHHKEEPRVVQDAHELANFLSRGWAEHPSKVEEARQRYELEQSDNAAQLLADDRHLSPAAKAEYDAVNDAADDHVLDLPAGKLDKSKKKKKAEEAKE